MKIYVLMEWDEHEGLFNQHEPTDYFLNQEKANKAWEEKVASAIAGGYIESNALWYEGSDSLESDDVHYFVKTIDVIE